MQFSTRLGIVVLLALFAASLAVIAPTGVAAEGDHGAPRTRPTNGDGGPGGTPTGQNPPDQGAGADGETATDIGTGPAVTDEVSSGGTSTVTTTTDLNLRGEPSMESEVLAVMPAGSSVERTGDSENGFVAVSFGGVTGYAYGDYLSSGGVGDGEAAPTKSDEVTIPSSGTSAAGSDIVSIIYAAADAYGQSREDMLRVATCESGLDPNNVTPPYDASGLFQFLPGTWASTPFAAQSVFDPVANANAAAWMWSVGRRGEWVC